MKPSPENLQAGLEAFLNRIPFLRAVPMTIAEARRGFVSLVVKSSPALFNHFQTYQAGSIFTLAEVAGGVLCGTFLDLSENLLLTKRGGIDFKRGTSQDLCGQAELSEETITKVLKELATRKKTDIEIPVVIREKSGGVIAECRFLYYLRVGIPDLWTR